MVQGASRTGRRTIVGPHCWKSDAVLCTRSPVPASPPSCSPDRGRRGAAVSLDRYRDGRTPFIHDHFVVACRYLPSRGSARGVSPRAISRTHVRVYSDWVWILPFSRRARSSPEPQPLIIRCWRRDDRHRRGGCLWGGRSRTHRRERFVIIAMAARRLVAPHWLTSDGAGARGSNRARLGILRVADSGSSCHGHRESHSHASGPPSWCRPAGVPAHHDTSSSSHPSWTPWGGHGHFRYSRPGRSRNRSDPTPYYVERSAGCE